MRDKRRIAAFVSGARNLTRVTAGATPDERGWEWLRQQVAAKKPGTYYVFEVRDSTWQRASDDPIATWHVGEGFAHADGWWVS